MGFCAAEAGPPPTRKPYKENLENFKAMQAQWDFLYGDQSYELPWAKIGKLRDQKKMNVSGSDWPKSQLVWKRSSLDPMPR